MQATGLLQYDRGRGDRKIQDINSNQTKQSDLIKFYVHNIQGLSIEKFNDVIDEAFTALYDSVYFTETWPKECIKDAFEVKGYTFINKQRSFIHRKAKRGAGGVLLYIKNTILTKVVVLNKKRADDRIWIRLKSP